MIPHPALAIAEKFIIPESHSSVPFQAVHRGKSHLAFHVLDAHSRLGSIRRASSFKIHLKKHGWDTSACSRFPPRDHSLTEVWRSTEPEGGQVSISGGSPYSQVLPLSGLSESWDSDPFFSLPLDPCKSITLPAPQVFIACSDIFLLVTVALPLIQAELTSVVPPSSSLLFAPSPQSAPDNEQFFLSSLRASPAASSRYSSPLASTPPETVPGFITDFGVQLSSCLAANDWTRNAWQDQGIQFV